MKKGGILALAAAGAITCLSMVAIGTYALFSDTVTVTNHLRAGTLKATLVRTAHSYSILDATGMLKETKVENENVKSTEMQNAFDLPDDALIVPMSKLSATFQLQNNDTVAFDYSVEIVLGNSGNDQTSESQINVDYLAEQLEVKLTGLPGTHTLSDSGLIVEGTEPVEVGESVNFTLELEFKDDDLINNLAQDANCNFDLVVSATQAIR